MACLWPCLRTASDPAGLFYTCVLDGDHGGDHYDPARQASFRVDPVTGRAQVTGTGH